MDDRTVHFWAAAAAFVGGWLMGRRRGYDEAVGDSEKLGVATNKLQAMLLTGKLECPRCARMEDELRFALDDLEAERARVTALEAGTEQGRG